MDESNDLIAPVRKAGMPEREPLRWYPGVIRNIERDTSSKYHDVEFKWSFALDVDKGQGRNGSDRETYYWSDAELPSKDDNRLSRLLRQLDGNEFNPAAAVDLRKFIGVRVDVMFQNNKLFAVRKGE